MRRLAWSFPLLAAAAIGPVSAAAESIAVPPLTLAEGAVAFAPVAAAPRQVHVFAASEAPPVTVPPLNAGEVEAAFAPAVRPVATHVFAAAPVLVEPVKTHVFAASTPTVPVPALNKAEAAVAFAPVVEPIATHVFAAAQTPAPLVTPQPVTVLDAALLKTALAERLADPAFRAGSDAAAIREFYAERSGDPVWTAGGAWTDAAKAALARLARAAEDGLDPSRYIVSDLVGQTPSADDLARAEVELSAALVAYSRHASSGRLDTTRIERGISALVTVDQHAPDPVEALRTLAVSRDIAAALDYFNPRHPGFLRLKTKLAEIRAKAKSELAAADRVVLVPDGPSLRLGSTGPRVALLRERLGLQGADGASYDDVVLAAVRSFQQDNGLRVTGIVGPLTLRALNSIAKPDYTPIEAEIIANMERWRWMPRDLGDDHIFVNVPQYELWVKIAGRVVYESRVIVGKPETPTPIFSDTMRFVVVNPSWYVPQSVIRKEFQPRLANDPNYLARRGFDVSYRNGRIVGVRQPPGAGNALGHIKFMFPNKHSVYLHDTSSRSLFASERRAYSHGCVRVDAPFDFAEVVMRPEFGWTADKIKALVGRGERQINLQKPIAIHIAYFTAVVDDDGELRLFDDIYGHDARVLQALVTPRA